MGATAAAIGVGASIYKDVMDYKNDKEAKKAEEKRLNEEKGIKEEELARKTKIYKSEKTNLLKAKVASHRALMGASGVAPDSGSSGAVVGRIERDVEEDINNDEFFADLNLRDMQSTYNYRKKKNLLDLESSRLNRDMAIVNSATKLF
ncbi:MAG: hypothetical protein LBI17_03985 [Rickettsiales bacterium]|jgi:hypothetical protein|nr:hypothetical protein [Rickettsiales bacterium]